MGLPSIIADIRQRRRSRYGAIDLDRYRVRIARAVQDYEDAFKLLHIAAIAQGYEPVGGIEMRITPQHVLPESTVLVAHEDDMLVGTITNTLDSPAGLPIERICAAAVRDLRGRGARIVEFGSLGVVRRCWQTGVSELLLIAVHRLARSLLHATHAMIAVTPRMVTSYRANYGLVSIGKPQHSDEIGGDAQAMVVELDKLEEHVARHLRQPMRSGHRLVEHLQGVPLPCIDLPEGIPEEEMVRWKMSREVFRELFIDQGNRIDSLDATTRRYLETRRSRQTLQRVTPMTPKDLADMLAQDDPNP